MNNLVANASILIRRPVAEVFRAFVEPGMITRFWLESTTGPLAKGAKVTWRFMVPGVEDTLTVTAFDDPKRIAFDWPDGTSAELTFEPYRKDSTILAVKARGFRGADAGTAAADTVEGYTVVFCDLKLMLETGKSPDLVKDKAELIVAQMPR